MNRIALIAQLTIALAVLIGAVGLNSCSFEREKYAKRENDPGADTQDSHEYYQSDGSEAEAIRFKKDF